MTTRRRLRSNKGSLIEIAPVLLILLIFVVLPLIDLAAVGTGMASVVLLTHEVASRAANQQTYDNALAMMQQEANRVLATGFARFAGLTPAGGYQTCGVDLYIQATNFRNNGTTTMSGPNSPVQGAIDPTQNIYEVIARAHYKVGPAISFAGVPILSGVPGLGKPADIDYSVCRNVEHASGLGRLTTDPTNSNASVTVFDKTIRNTSPPPSANGTGSSAIANGFDPSGWNFPGLYDAIAKSGQTIVAENVIIVHATDSWVATGISVSPGETIWVDSRADGSWQLNNLPIMDASGAPGGTPANLAVDVFDKNSTIGALIGCVGTPPVVPLGAGGVSSTQLFQVGKTLMNFPVTGTGAITMQVNDNYCHTTGGLGQQCVRIIVTK